MAGNTQKIGWIGMGRMGFPMAERLLKAGCDVSIWNRTRAKARQPMEPVIRSPACGVPGVNLPGFEKWPTN